MPLSSRILCFCKRNPLIFVLAVATLTFLIATAAVFAQDDWQVIQRNTSSDASAGQSTATPQASGSASSPASPGAVSVCGENATAASPAIQRIVDRINALWGSNFQVYQSVALEQPHASPGGCIFYNLTAMNMLMANRLDVNDSNAVTPMMWAIFAHEAGHEYHRDSEASRANVPIEEKELEADRFAGFTLEKLKIRATDLTPFWTMTGDDYGGGGGNNKHGSSEQRVAAFKQGWNLAEWNRQEDSKSVDDALNEPIAPDSPDSAPK